VFVRYATGKHSRKLVVDEMLALCATNERMSTVLISDNDDADEIIGAISDGVKGYIVTSVSLKVAIEAMRLVKAGGTYIPASSLMGGRNLSLCDDGNADSRERFTPRQMAVLEEIKKGKANKLIAYDLNMKESTVKVHVRNIMRKVGATNRTEVAVMSFDYGRSGR
jgi:DNA-binding NarL/FixJ family response regulator